MKQKAANIIKLITPLILSAVLCSCTFFDIFSVDSLIRAPKLTGENAAVQNAFEESAGNDILLVNPLSGSYRSAYVICDMNGDEINEAVVFYAPKNKPDEVHMNILTYNGGKWGSVCDTVGNGSEVYSVDFVNLDEDAELEIAVVWSMPDSKKSKTLSIYKVLSVNDSGTQKNIVSLASVHITDFLVEDVNADGINEVFYTYSSVNSSSPSFNASVFKISSQELTAIPLSDMSISKNTQQILQVKTDFSKNGTVFYVDCLAGDGRYFTEVIGFNSNSNAMSRVLDKNGKALSEFTYRNEYLLSCDKNGDGKIEIPAQTEFPDSRIEDSNGSTDEKLFLTSYLYLTDDGCDYESRYYVNNSLNFRIKVDDFWKNVYVVFNTDTGSTQFRWRGLPEKENLLFTVSVNEKGDSGERFFTGVTEFGESRSFTSNKLDSIIEPI